MNVRQRIAFALALLGGAYGVLLIPFGVEREKVPRAAAPSISLPDRQRTAPFIHPGLLNSQAELERIQALILDPDPEQGQVMKAGWRALRENPMAQLTYRHQAYAEVVLEPACSGPDEAQMKRDAQSTYLHALEWVITGERAHAQKAIEIMNDWANVFVRFIPCDDEFGTACDLSQEPLPRTTCERGARVEGAWLASMWAPAAEIIRHFDQGRAGWEPEAVARFSGLLDHFVQTTAPDLRPRLAGANNHVMSGIHALIAVGVFNDNHALYEEGLAGWKEINGKIVNGDGVYREFDLRRDCYHYLYSINGQAQAAEIAWHQGDDLYGITVDGETQPRLRKGLRFASRILLGELVHAPLTVEGAVLPAKSCTCSEAPGLALPYNHYEHRTSVKQDAADLAQLVRAFSDCPIDNESIAQQSILPDDAKTMFLGWTAVTHGDLSAR